MNSYVCVLIIAFFIGANCQDDVKVDSTLVTPKWSLGALSDKNDGNYEASASEHTQTYNAGITVGLQSQPHLEILQLAETFLKLKGEIASKIYAVIQENSDLINSVTKFAISKVSHLHKFTLNGIAILRRVLQVAVDLFGQWGLPSLTVALNKPLTPAAFYPEIPPVSANIPVQHHVTPISANIPIQHQPLELGNSYGNYGEFYGNN